MCAHFNFTVCLPVLIVCVFTYFVMCVSTKEECVTDEDEEGQMNETPWQGKKGVICPDMPEEKQSTPERGVHDENGTNLLYKLFQLIYFFLFYYPYFFVFVCVFLILCKGKTRSKYLSIM